MIFLPIVTEIHDTQLVEYVDAGCLMDARKYEEAKKSFESLSGYIDADGLALEAKYRWALQLADKGEFSSAVKLLDTLSKKGYKDSEEKVKDIHYRWAWALVDEEKYTQALPILESIRGYSDVNDAISIVKELIYLEGQTLYYEKEFVKAKSRFQVISSYADSEKYLILLDAQCSSLFQDTEMIVDNLIGIFSFEDAAKLLLSTHAIGEKFLSGKWKGDGYYFTLDDEGSISYSLPWFDYGDFYRIEDGAILLFPEDDENNTRVLFNVSALTPDSIQVFCHKNSKTYTLYRQ